jgi:hypothetical protein
MSECKFEQSWAAGGKDWGAGEDITLFTTRDSDCIKPTSVYLTNSYYPSDRMTAILWLHGLHLEKDFHSLFEKEATKLREAVADSGKDLILIAPYLGDDNTYDEGELATGGGCQRYLRQVLRGLAQWWQRTHGRGDPDQSEPPKFDIANLIVACHSRGGAAMREVTDALGSYRSRLVECWGFDCVYGTGRSWWDWARGMGDVDLYFYFGTGTEGNTADPLGFWRLSYGTAKNPLPDGGALPHLHLAPALPGVAVDHVAFQSTSDILQKPDGSGPYEDVRKQADPYLDDHDQYFRIVKRGGLYEHYRVVRALLSPRIRQSFSSHTDW